MKKTVIFIIIITLITVVVFGASVVMRQRRAADDMAMSVAEEITVQAVARHNTTDSCWIIIGSKVYSVSRLFEQKSDLTATLSPNCGGTYKNDNPTPELSKLLTQLQPYYIGLIVP